MCLLKSKPKQNLLMHIPLKKTVLALPVLLVLAFGSFPKPKFKLLDATSQHWTAGIAGGGSGTDYSFKVMVQASGKIRFDSAWLNGKSFLIQAVKGKQFNPQAEYSKHDTINLRISDFVPGRKPGANSPSENETTKPRLNPPVPYKGEALIRYYVDNKQHYYTVGQIKKLPSMNMP
jgi:hypothetical protein